MAKSRGTTVYPLERSPSHLLHRVLQLALEIYGEEVGSASLSQRQFAVLCAVAADEGVSQTGLVRVTRIDRSTMADIIARMISGGLLMRERSAADARSNTVRTTDRGRAALAKIAPRVASADKRVLDMLGFKKRDPFIAALRRLARSASVDGRDEPGPSKDNESTDQATNLAVKAKKPPKPIKKKKSKLVGEAPGDDAPRP